MRVGVPKEIKDHEDRVGLVPSSVAELVRHGHEVLIQAGAGVGAGLEDDLYVAAGGRIVPTADEIFRDAEMVVKVKEPLAPERKKLRPGQVLFTYLHLAPDREQTQELLKSGVTGIAYETVTSPIGTLPLLTPMSEIAGRLAPQVGARYLERTSGGRGVLLGGVPGVPPAEVVVLGGGVSGTHAATIALGMGAIVTVVDRSAEVLRRIAVQLPGARTIFSTHDALVQVVRRADLLDRRRAGAGRRRAQADHARHGEDDEERQRAGRHRDRPGRLQRDVETDQPFRSGLCGRWRDALLRHQHAGRGGAHLDLRAQQRDLAVRAGAGRQGLAARDRRGPAPAQRAQRPRRQAHLQAGRRSAGARLHSA